MIQRQLPYWARLENPVLRQTLNAPRAGEPRRIPYVRVFLAALLVAVMIAAGVVVGSDLFAVDLFDLPISQALMAVIFWPVFVVQIVLRLAALGMTVGAVGEEKRRQTWDSLRTTYSGASLALRARWSAVVFYRLRPGLLLVTVARLVLIGAVLYDLTAFSGEYLNYLTGNITPDVGLPVAVLLLALTMTASLLLPLTAVGFDAALGLFVSTFVEQRIYVALAQITLSALRIGIIGLLLLLMTDFRVDFLIEGSTQAGLWLLVFGFAALGDWGLSLLWLGFFGGEVWPTVDYSLLVGLALLGFVFVQTLLTDGLLALTVRRAEMSE